MADTTTTKANGNGNGQHVTWAQLKIAIPIIIALVGWAVTWGIFQTRIEYTIEELRETRLEVRELKNNQATMQTSLVELQKDLSYLTVLLERHEKETINGTALPSK